MDENFEAFWKGVEEDYLESCMQLPYEKEDALIVWQAAQPQWQPIETAPRDGSPVWCYEGREGSDVFALFISFFKSGVWVQVGKLGFDERLQNPTHWMPLPLPPQQ